MDKDSAEEKGTDKEGGFSQAEALKSKLGEAGAAAVEAGAEGVASPAPLSHNTEDQDRIRERIAALGTEEPGVEVVDRAEQSTLAERHPDWPRVSMEFFFSPHGTAEDMEGLIQLLQQGGVDIYLYEDTEFSDSSDYTKTLQTAADMKRPKFFKRWLKGQNAIDGYVRGLSIGDEPAQPVADEKEPGFSKKWGARLRSVIGGSTEGQKAKGKPIAGTPFESQVRALYDTGAIVDNIDLRPGDPVEPGQLGAEAHRTPMTTEGGFEALLGKIEEQYRQVIGLEELREQVMPKRLEERLEKIFEQHPELKDKPDLKIVMSMGSAHAATLPPRFQEMGVETTQTFSRPDYTYDYQSQARMELASGEQPEPETLARAYFEQILGTELGNRGCNDVRRHDDLMRYLRQTAGAFSKDEIAGLYERNSAGELNGARLDELFDQKGLPSIPSSYAELVEAVSESATA